MDCISQYCEIAIFNFFPPTLEFAVPVWSHFLINLNYENRFRKLESKTVKDRRLRRVQIQINLKKIE